MNQTNLMKQVNSPVRLLQAENPHDLSLLLSQVRPAADRTTWAELLDGEIPFDLVVEGDENDDDDDEAGQDEQDEDDEDDEDLDDDDDDDTDDLDPVRRLLALSGGK